MVQGCSVLLFVIGATVAFFAVLARIDSHDDLAAIQTIDVVLGLIFAAAILAQAMGRASGVRRRNRSTAILALCVWIAVSGSLLAWHHMQVFLRSTTPRSAARMQIQMAYIALEEYAKEKGRLPTEEEGLKALSENQRGTEKVDAYFPAKYLVDPWGNPLRYELRENRPRVWSNGRDGVSGTADDVVDSNEQEWGESIKSKVK